jgi:hypothetical protein
MPCSFTAFVLFKEVVGTPSGKYVLGITKVVYVYTKIPAEQGKVSIDIINITG